MKIKQYQVDAFATRVFEGNPAAVCPLDSWLDDETLQAIATENNLSETAFFVPATDGFELRWFTPAKEVDLCGHATLATAHVLFNILGYTEPAITFATRSGDLTVKREGDILQMDFPAIAANPCEVPETLIQGIGVRPREVLAADDYITVFDDEETIRSITPNHTILKELELRGVIVTAPGNDVDFVSRFFAPKFGVAEDPVTGPAHCQLAPYWAARLGKNKLFARQLSKRGGSITCEVVGERVLLSGGAVTFMEAEIYI